jgi:hypothetical protein
MMTVGGEMRRSELIFLIPLVALTVALRLVVLGRSEWMTDGDEALTGLMALHILQGDRPVFLNGQSYMGAYQAYVAAGLFAIFGVSTIALKIVPLIGSVAFILSTYMLARRLISPWGACAAGLVAAVPPVYILANMSKAWAPHAEVMAFGNVLILLAIRQHARDARRAEPVLFGALAGFAFWLHPFVAYYLVVCGCILMFGQPVRTLIRLPLLLAGIVVGTTPVWIANVAYASDAFRYLTVPTSAHQDIGAIASYLVYSGLPRAMGWWQPWGVLPQPAAWLLIGTTGVGLLVLFVRGRQTHGLRIAPTDAPILLAISVPAMFVMSGFGGPSQNPWGFDATGRYLMPLWGVVPLAVAAFAQFVLKSHWIPVSAVTLVVGAQALGYATADPLQIFQSPYWNRLPAQSTALENYLLEHGVTRVWMNHWAGFPLMLRTGERVIAADYYDVVKGGGISRFPEHFDAMQHAEQTAYILVTTEYSPPLLGELQDLGVDYRAERFDQYLVVQPLSRRVEPWEVADSIGYKY